MSETRSDWSKLSPDLLRSILERLRYTGFHRARSVCSNWYAVSKTCVQRPLYPWRILFDEHSTLLFDPGEDENHEIGHPELELSKSLVMSSCSNWLLMVDLSLNLYLQNVFTRERINLPSIESSSLLVHKEWKHFAPQFSSSCLWINERTKDYVVAWSYMDQYLLSYKKGDDSWWNHQGIDCESMAYKDEKLYVYTFHNYIKILDFSGDSPVEVVQGNPYRNHPFQIVPIPKTIAITSSGEVLIVLSYKGWEDIRSFYIYKMNLENGRWERVVSLGGEMLIFGHGVTIRAPIKDVNGWGIKGDSICFRDDDLLFRSSFGFSPHTSINGGVFDLETSTVTSLDVAFLKSFWFVPGYA